MWSPKGRPGRMSSFVELPESSFVSCSNLSRLLLVVSCASASVLPVCHIRISRADCVQQLTNLQFRVLAARRVLTLFVRRDHLLACSPVSLFVCLFIVCSHKATSTCEQMVRATVTYVAGAMLNFSSLSNITKRSRANIDTLTYLMMCSHMLHCDDFVMRSGRL
jgi:hypothetical protein